MIYVIAFIIAGSCSVILTLLVKKLAKTFKVLDQPNQADPRKIHRQPTPLLGGLAVFIAFAVTTGFLWYFGLLNTSRISPLQIFAFLLGGAILMIGGILDDKKNLHPAQQIIFPIIATSLVIASGIRVTFVTNPLGGILAFPLWFGTVMAFGWILGMTYTTKLLDGLDGLLAGVTAIGAVIIFGVSLVWDVPQSATSVMAIILAGSALGFLIFNWHPAKIFLGEAGSVWCGYSLSVLAIISGSKIATALLIMGVPILDVVWVIIRRLWQGSSPTRGDRGHLHFRLLDLGLSQRQTVLVLYAITMTFGLSSLFLQSFGKVVALLSLGGFMALLIIFLVLVYNSKNASRN